jgi:hypothetical protein
MPSYMLPEQPGRQLDRLIKVLRMAIGGLWVDSRHDVLMPGSAVLLSARLARACRPRGWLARRLR